MIQAIAAPEVEQEENLTSAEEVCTVPEVSQAEWTQLLEKDSNELTGTEIVQRDRPYLRNAKAGDSTAWATIWGLYENAIVKKVREFFWDHEEIYDVTLAIYMRAFEKLSTFNPEKRFFPWIHTVIRNYCLNLIKHQNVVKMVQVGGMTEVDFYNMKDDLGIDPCLEDHSLISVRDKVAKDEEVENLYKCIEHLNDKHKEIIDLNHFQELSYKEISDKLNIPMGTVMSRLFNARSELASIWNDIIDDLPART